MYEIYTDGAVSGNGKSSAPGGWAYVILRDGMMIAQDSGGEVGTTNQRMELTAALNACKEVEKMDAFARVRIYSDSAYLVNCWKQNWWRAWQANGWKNSKKQPVANPDLWMGLIPFFEKTPNGYDFIKVQGHQTHNDSQNAYWNNIVDGMAVRAKQRIIDRGGIW